MPTYRKFIVEPSLPKKLAPLEDIAYNLWWTWNPDAVNLLRRIEPDLWDELNHNPVHILGVASQRRLKELEEDDGFLTHTKRVLLQLKDYLNGETWFKETSQNEWNPKSNIAYFSLEFGIDECLPIYSGGLGVLAGDHLKSASDLGLPLVGIGLAYSHGYFEQYLNPDGWQQEVQHDNNFDLLPLKLQMDADSNPIKVKVPYPNRTVQAQIWKAEVGRVPLYLLDTNIPENRPDDQQITSQLYGGDLDMRIRQEILIGIGGVKALHKLGVDVSAFHMNEGHSAFLNIERIVHLMRDKGFTFFEAKEACIASTVFTTHTPVPAGNDRFEKAIVQAYVTPVIKDTDIDLNRLIALGRINPSDNEELFCMTVFALRLSAGSNGVSKLHGNVSRHMWKDIWKDVPIDLVPILSITNGIHIRTWISKGLRNLFERYLGVSWINKPGDDTIWKKISKIPDSELWRAHEVRRERLVAFTRKRLVEQLKRRGASESELKTASEVLDPETLTIGFARRFATYKRGTLILRDIERLTKILGSKDMPVQIIFAGKAHPKDMEGKNLIKDIIHAARINGLGHRLVFIENYNIDVARYLVQGCDVWLNNPRRPLEASGTSGMKAAANGVLNLSVLDGWWDEGYTPETGWAIGHGEDYEDHSVQDAVESKNLYDVIEKDIIPLFYNRGSDGLPREWVSKMKSSMTTLNPVFNTNRMVREYAKSFYLPLGRRWEKYVVEQPEIIKSLAKWKLKLKNDWSKLKVISVDEGVAPKSLKVGQRKRISTVIQLAGLSPDELVVECYFGALSHDELLEGETVTLKCEDKNEEGEYRFGGEIPCDNAGPHGFAIRVMPSHKDMVSKYIPGLILWG